jgi:hypothetical protein
LRKKSIKLLLHLTKTPKVSFSRILSYDLAAHHAKSPEAVTSDEEGALSGEETKRPGKWTRRISGSFQRLTGPSKDKEIAPEVPKKDVSPAPVAEGAVTETPAVEEVAPVTTETPVVDAPVEPTTGISFLFIWLISRIHGRTIEEG